MTETPRRRRIGESASEPPAPEPYGTSGPDRRGTSPKADLAGGTPARAAFALVAALLVAIFGVVFGLGPGWLLLFGAFALACGLSAPAARALAGRSREGRVRPVGSSTGAPAAASAAAPAAVGIGEKDAERQLLEAIERHGEATAARVALETSLTVFEADRMLGELAQTGHLRVHARDGKLVYSF